MHAKVTSFLLVIFTTLILANAHAHQGNAAPAQSTVFTKKDIEGRKMLSHHVKGPEKVKNMETNGGLSEISSTNDFARKCDMKSEAASGRNHRRSARSVTSKEVGLVGFVAFNADYHGPQHHPPKNN